MIIFDADIFLSLGVSSVTSLPGEALILDMQVPRNALLHGIEMPLWEGAVPCCPRSMSELGRSPCSAGHRWRTEWPCQVPGATPACSVSLLSGLFFVCVCLCFFFFVITSAWEEFRSQKNIQSPFLCEWQDKTSQSPGRISVVKAGSVPGVRSLAGAVSGTGLPSAGLSAP